MIISLFLYLLTWGIMYLGDNIGGLTGAVIFGIGVIMSTLLLIGTVIGLRNTILEYYWMNSLSQGLLNDSESDAESKD